MHLADLYQGTGDDRAEYCGEQRLDGIIYANAMSSAQTEDKYGGSLLTEVFFRMDA